MKHIEPFLKGPKKTSAGVVEHIEMINKQEAETKVNATVRIRLKTILQTFALNGINLYIIIHNNSYGENVTNLKNGLHKA